MHNATFAKLRLDYAYLAFEADNNTLEDAVKGLRSLKLKGTYDNSCLATLYIFLDTIKLTAEEINISGSI
ncbi:shikimate dehydrogenase [Clostridium saccharoperbutylacetonicum]|uniref:shikimate dehydrogenase n=1 Tax=Clostridium saccharoperbutylacetonicum TaxID=36745 RepID=UPI00098406A5|nr:shikimate dehydrogenase [Clostridium saccharoperbutylacetonicum]NSB33345.1 shikimate dehydrogenase [Clostridium saccharoperbutylacetonicum]